MSGFDQKPGPARRVKASVRIRIRLGGKELGPFAASDVRSLLVGRTLQDSPLVDGWLDEATGAWRAFSDGFSLAGSDADSAPSFLDSVTVHSTYYRVTMAGIVLFCLWALVFTGIRLWTGKWPGQGSRPHSNRVIREELPAQEFREPGYPSPWDTPAHPVGAGTLPVVETSAPMPGHPTAP